MAALSPPTPVTDDLPLGERTRLISTLVSNINQATEGDRYDGSKKGYRVWARAVTGQLSGVYLDDVEIYAAQAACKTWSTDEWDLLYSQSDRQFIYQVITGTLTETQVDIVENSEKNGILVLHHYHNLHGAPTLPNTIQAFSELMSLKVRRHENPAPAFKSIERIFSDFFNDIEPLKIAILFHVLDEVKYKPILDTIELRQHLPDFDTIKRELLEFFARKHAKFEADRAAHAGGGGGAPNPKQAALLTNARSGPGRGGGRNPHGGGGRGRGRGRGGGSDPKRKRQTSEELEARKKHMETIVCFKCGKPGHYAVNCPGPQVADDAKSPPDNTQALASMSGGQPPKKTTSSTAKKIGVVDDAEFP